MRAGKGAGGVCTSLSCPSLSLIRTTAAVAAGRRLCCERGGTGIREEESPFPVQRKKEGDDGH